MTDKQKEKIAEIKQYAIAIHNRATNVLIAPPDVPTDSSIGSIIDVSDRIAELARILLEEN